MAQNTFSELFFDVPKEVFYEVLENQDTGFGFRASLKKKCLDELQIDTLNFLVQCYKKKFLGLIRLRFGTHGIGEIKELNRTIEKIEENKDEFIISNSY